MTVQIPKSLKPIAKEVSSYVRTHKVFMADQVSAILLDNWERKCQYHELFWTDLDRYMGDLHTDFTHKGAFK